MEIWSALLGAVIGGLLTIAGAWAQAAYYRHQKLRSLTSALTAEISTLVTLARANNYGPDLLAQASEIRAGAHSGHFTSIVVSATHNYFSIYEANAGDLGDLPGTLSSQVVAFYQAARSWLDSMSFANKPGDGTVSRVEAAARQELLGHQINRICEFGDNLVLELASSAMKDSIQTSQTALAVLPTGSR